MNYEEIESLLIGAEAENNAENFYEAERICHLILESIPPFSSQNLDESEEHFKRMLNLRANLLTILSISLWRRGMAMEALPSAEEALHLSIQSENKDQEAKALGSLGIVYAILSDYPRVLEYQFKALSIQKELGNILGQARASGNIGLAYKELLDYPRALEFFSKSIGMFEEIGDKYGVATTTGNIGLIYYGLSDYPRALEYYSKALAISEEIGNRSGVATNIGNIGGIYIHLSDYPRALEYLTKAVSIYEEIEDKSAVARNIGNIGVVYNHLSDYPRAMEYYSRALALSEEIRDKSEVANSIKNIGEMYRNKEFEGYDLNKSEEHLIKAKSIFEEIGMKNFGVLLSLSDLYKSMGRWEDALINFEQYYTVEKEVLSEEAKKKVDLYEHQKQAAEREKEIEIAKAAAAARMNATTSLLHRVLPESISTRMIGGEENISDFFPSVSILFADIKGFTAISSNMKAIDVVRFLNFVFGEFDRIMNVHGCEKIKTIGDGYMAMAGAPIECEDHAERLAAAAIEMQETIHLPEDILFTMPAESRFGIRIGLHTGSVVAGVIGQERFVYDIHSDAVNLASRMESSGEVGRVHVSSDFAEHLQARFKQTKNSKHGMHFEDRGETNIKGKGMMKTYFLEKES